MDPLMAIGLVGNIIAFIDFSAKVLKSAKHIHGSSHSTLEENRSRETVVQEMKQMSEGLLTPKSIGLPRGDANLETLAVECHEISIQLISLLNKIKPKDPSSIGQSILSALKNKLYEKDREDLEVRLGNCRAQLELQFNFLARNEAREKLEKLVAASKNDEIKLEELHRQVIQLRTRVELSSPGPGFQFHLKLLVATEKDIVRTIAGRRILECISFQEMDRREDMVVDTHSDTYAWIVEDDETTRRKMSSRLASIEVKLGLEQNDNTQKGSRHSLEDEKIRAREKLGSWLAARNTRDIFHLSGKLGSGRSTLMKYIAGSHLTAERLYQWAAGRKLTIASFYFWHAGSEYEKSLRGLYRGLLYRILKDCPELITTALPIQYQKATSAPWLKLENSDISGREIVKAFARIIDSHHLYKRHCFCLFIDGLDEFQATVQDSYTDLVNLLCRWGANAPRNVRICVSSREYPVFMDSFSPNSRIRLHELTRTDMAIYIDDKLGHASKDVGFIELIPSIMNKANGVFLWVALVVKLLVEGLENGMSCADLTHEVDVLPDELKTLYKHVLDSLSSTARRRAYKTFAMIAKLKHYSNYRMSLLAYSFLDDYERDESFFMKETGSFSYSSLTGNSGKERSISTRKKLAGWCKGLVEPYNGSCEPVRPDEHHSRAMISKSKWENWNLELDFTHRSVLEFIDSEEMRHDTKQSLNDSEISDTLSNLLVADVLFDNATTPYNVHETTRTLGVLLSMRQDHSFDSAPYTFLERLRSLLEAGTMVSHLKPGMVLWQGVGCNGAVNSMCVFVGNNFTIKTSARKPSTTGTNEDKFYDSVTYIVNPLYSMISSGSCDYPLWYISNNASRLGRNSTAISMLTCCSIWTNWIGEYTDARSIRIVEALLEKGLLSPGMITDCIPLTESLTAEAQPTSHWGLTIWQYFLIGIVAVSHEGWKQYERTRTIGDLLQLFLRWEPNLDLSFSLFRDSGPTNERKFCCRIGKRWYIIGIKFQDEGSEDRSINSIWRVGTGRLPATATNARKDYELRGFIESCPFENKEIILQMIDEQLGRSTQDGFDSKNKDVSGVEDWDPEENDKNPGPTDEALEITGFGAGARKQKVRQAAAFLESVYFKFGFASLVVALVSTLMSYVQKYLE